MATVGVDASVNAAVLAAQIVGVADKDIQARLWRFKDDLAEGLRHLDRAATHARGSIARS